MKFFKFGLLSLSLGLFIFACSQNDTTKTTNVSNSANTVNSVPATQPTTAVDQFAAARKIYTEKCVRCHKEDGSGGKTDFDGTTINAENLTTDKQKKEPDSDYVEAIEKGFPEDGMPAFKGKLTDQEIKDVVKYIRKEIQRL